VTRAALLGEPSRPCAPGGGWLVPPTPAATGHHADITCPEVTSSGEETITIARLDALTAIMASSSRRNRPPPTDDFAGYLAL
jgi:hypothetical protein